jgi:hypothetical protein
MGSKKMFDYRVRIQVAEDSPDGVLLDFIKNERHPSFSHKEMVLWALRGYWMAIALRQRSEVGNTSVSDAQIQRMALDTIHQLRQQIVYVRSACDMPEQLGSSTSENRANSRGKRLGKLRKGEQDRPLIERSSERITVINSPQAKPEDWYGGADLFDSSV